MSCLLSNRTRRWTNVFRQLGANADLSDRTDECLHAHIQLPSGEHAHCGRAKHADGMVGHSLLRLTAAQYTWMFLMYLTMLRIRAGALSGCNREKISPHTGISELPCAFNDLRPSIVSSTILAGKTPLFFFASSTQQCNPFRQRHFVPMPLRLFRARAKSIWRLFCQSELDAWEVPSS